MLQSVTTQGADMLMQRVNVSDGYPNDPCSLQIKDNTCLLYTSSTLEGLDVVQFPYEYILEKAWNLNVDDNKWIECLADRHVGCVSQPCLLYTSRCV